MEIGASMKVLDSITVVISTKHLIPVPFLVFYLVQAVGKANGFISLITRLSNCISFNFMKLSCSAVVVYSPASFSLGSL